MRVGFRSLVVLSMLVGAVGWVGSSAGATPPGCVDAPCTVSFAMTGSIQSWTVPAGVDHVTAAVAAGSGGASAYSVSGGFGGAVTASVPVDAGDVFSILVGAAGADGSFMVPSPPVAAYGGGGRGAVWGFGPMTDSDGSGGGGSFVFDATAGDELLVAAGGGGGTSGNATSGGDGGSGGAGSDGSLFCGFNESGTGGTLSAVGAGGGWDIVGGDGTGPATSPTLLGWGGDAHDGRPGGGGGGGYYGGGAGGHSDDGSTCGAYGSGGGGSGFLAASATNVSTSTNTGDGSVSITFQVAATHSTTPPTTSDPGPSSAPPSASPTISAAPSPSGGSVVVELSSATVRQGGQDSATGRGFTPGEQVTATLHSTPVSLGVFTASPTGVVRFAFTVPEDEEPGQHTLVISGANSGLTASASLTVTASTASVALPNTGAATSGPFILGLALLVGGVGAVAISRSRRGNVRDPR